MGEHMLLKELQKKLSDKFYMSIKQTYVSFNLDENTNIFIESFDGINFSIIRMDRSSLEMETLAEISASTELELNQKIGKVVNGKYDFTA